MALGSFDEFNDMHKSVLQEICNMGAGNAATSLAQMLSTPTDISTPQVKINPAGLAGRVADMLSKEALAYHIELSGDVLGSLLFIFPCAFIERFAQTFFPDASIKSKTEVDEMSESMVKEAVNISAAAYANSLALMSGLTVDISVPKPVETPSADIPSVKSGANVCFVTNTIEITDSHKMFTAMFYPELTSISGFMEKLGVA